MKPTKNILFNILTVMALTLSLAFVACEGPAGPEGPQGPQGEAGVVGPAGDDGSMMWAGSEAPTGDIGNEGDYYLNTTTGEYFGPKNGDGWGNPIIVLMGDDGQDGADGKDGKDGKTIHSGSGAPDASTGKEGDFYIDTEAQNLYGPKDSDGWGNPVSLNGEDGDDGADGDDGKDGSDGEDGEDGKDGSQMYAGDGAPGASLGKVGDYYLDQTDTDLYGPKSADGWGDPIDLSGKDGEDGADGEDGNTILSGTTAPANSLGSIGDFYLNTDTFDLYGPKNKNSWGAPINIKGEKGNANVTRYLFPEHNFSSDGLESLSVPGIDDNLEMRQSAWIGYMIKSRDFYTIPGIGFQGKSEYRTWYGMNRFNNMNYYIRLANGSGEEYDRIEIIRIRTSGFIDVNGIDDSLIPDHLDTSDYEAVAQYYGFGGTGGESLNSK